MTGTRVTATGPTGADPAAGVHPAAPRLSVLPGDPLRFGARVTGRGVTFTVYGAEADRMWLVLLDAGTGTPLAEVPFPEAFRCGRVFTMTVAGLDPAAVHYAYRAESAAGGLPAGWAKGPLLLDPYAVFLAGGETWGRRPAYRCRIAADDGFDWQGVTRPRIPREELVVYELHVRGFTRHPSSRVAHPGTYAGLTEKIPYLRELGVNCVELMPVFEFDDTDNPFSDPATGRPLPNYWGYHPVSFFAPKAAYAADPYGDGPARELKTLVRELHRAGIEVILDVVYNHTGEGGRQGPVLGWRGLDEDAAYVRAADGAYANLTGTGNTVNANHPRTRRMILDSLRHWASEYRVDGFRFDMAPILARGPGGAPLDVPPLLEAIAADPVLADRKLIAEPFDAAGLDLLGRFPRWGRWMEWNTRFQHTVRRALAGRPEAVGDLAERLAGSPDLYAEYGTAASVNLVACHDGLPLADWTTYERRRNEANGQGNTDGPPDDSAFNAGHEGPTDDPAVRALRDRLVRGALLLLLTAQGVPMLLAGDECGRTQRGNNNAYCQDNEVSWLDWAAAARHTGLTGLVRAALAFRRAHPALTRPDHPRRRFATAHDGVVVHLAHAPGDHVLVAVNCRAQDGEAELPEAPVGTRWQLFADTGLPLGQELAPAPGPLGDRLPLAAHAVAVLAARPLSSRTDLTERY
ncbi:glycogen debranching protein [Streptomyces misionensis]|uniref:glycogen debranching protein n=1 Tax=Streptomyces misionensis TaxID=67331 RepID=UPI0036F92304